MWRTCGSCPSDVGSEGRSLSHERQIVPGGTTVEVVFDEDGHGVLVSCREGDGSAEPTCSHLGDIFEYLVYEDDDGRTMLLMHEAKPVYIEDLESRFSVMDVKLRSGVQALVCNMAVASFERPPFMSLSLMWSLRDLFDALGHKAHKGKRWSWVSKNFPVWSTFLQHILPCHPRLLQKAASDESAPSGGSSVRLPWPSVCTPGLVALLLRFFAAPSSQAGRLQDNSAVAGAEALFAALLGTISGEPWVMQISFDEAAQVRWPRPVQGVNCVSLQVSTDLFLSFEGLDLQQMEKSTMVA